MGVLLGYKSVRNFKIEYIKEYKYSDVYTYNATDAIILSIKYSLDGVFFVCVNKFRTWF